MAAEDFEDLVETFTFLDDWEDRYRHVIDLGKALPPLDESLKVPATKVQGCASQVWLVPRIQGTGPDARFHFDGDSDAVIVRGLIAVLALLYNDRPVSEVGSLDAGAALAQLDLHDHLSSQRSNGLRAMVSRITALATAAAAG